MLISNLCDERWEHLLLYGRFLQGSQRSDQMCFKNSVYTNPKDWFFVLFVYTCKFTLESRPCDVMATCPGYLDLWLHVSLDGLQPQCLDKMDGWINGKIKYKIFSYSLIEVMIQVWMISAQLMATSWSQQQYKWETHWPVYWLCASGSNC